jgi:hypothetical protein
MLKNYLMVSLVIVGKIMITPSFLTKSKFTFVSVTEVSFTAVWEQHSFLGIVWAERQDVKKPKHHKQNTNQTILREVSQNFNFLIFSLISKVTLSSLPYSVETP